MERIMRYSTINKIEINGRNKLFFYLEFSFRNREEQNK